MNQQADGAKERIIVYDANGQQVLDTTEQAVLERFGDYVGQAGEKVDSADVFTSPLEDSKPSYHYVLTTRANRTVDLYLYDTEDVLVLKNLPLVGRLQLPLSEKEKEWLNHPKDW